MINLTQVAVLTGLKEGEYGGGRNLQRIASRMAFKSRLCGDRIGARREQDWLRRC